LVERQANAIGIMTHDPAATLPDQFRAMVLPDPRRPRPDRWRLVGFEHLIRAIIIHRMAFLEVDDPMRASDAQIAQTADAYHISDQAVRATIAYYAADRWAINSIIATNSDVTPEESCPRLLPGRRCPGAADRRLGCPRVTSVGQLGRKGLSNAPQLLAAVQSDRALIVCNVTPYKLLHEAWQPWTQAGTR
jgi:hypothetical protein